MRWLLVLCILLASGAEVLTNNRPKRDLSYIKNLIVSKLFGSETILIQQPEIPKNETYQLFNIKGYDDILLKVIRKPEKQKENIKIVIEKVQDPVIVSPEIAIVGSYLGTTTQSDTLLALEIAKNLLKTGILSGKRDGTVQELISMTPHLPYKDNISHKHVKPIKVFIEDRDPVYTYPSMDDEGEKIDIVNNNPVPLYPPHYPPILISSELKYRPVGTKYSYKQKGENADMSFESYNNQDVIVTKTDKEPPLPQFIKLRFADVASIGANPYFIKSHQPQEHGMKTLNQVRDSYGYLNPPVVVEQNMQEVQFPANVMERFPIPAKSVPNLEVMEQLGYIVPDNINSPPVWINRNSVLHEPLTVPNVITHSMLPLEVRDRLTLSEIGKINPIFYDKYKNINIESIDSPKTLLSISKNTEDSTITTKTNQKDSAEKDKQKANKNLKNDDRYRDIVTKYIYKQMNQNSHNKYTVVNVEDPPQLTKYVNLPDVKNSVKTNGQVPDDFIFVPPENVDVPPPNMIPKTNNIQEQIKNNIEDISSATENYPKGVILSKSKGDTSEPIPLDNTGDLKTSDQHSLKSNPIVVLDDKLNQMQKPIYSPYSGGPVF